jgi:predicted transcriptional regulator
MRPPKKANRHFFHPLDQVFGTEATVRILRMLALEPGAWSAGEIADRCSLGRPGTARALNRLIRTGVVERAGTGRRRVRFHLSRHPLARMVAGLFARERRFGFARSRTRQSRR